MQQDISKISFTYDNESYSEEQLSEVGELLQPKFKVEYSVLLRESLGPSPSEIWMVITWSLLAITGGFLMAFGADLYQKIKQRFAKVASNPRKKDIPTVGFEIVRGNFRIFALAKTNEEDVIEEAFDRLCQVKDFVVDYVDERASLQAIDEIYFTFEKETLTWKAVEAGSNQLQKWYKFRIVGGEVRIEESD